MCSRHVAHSLALELGWWDVDAMLDEMTCKQYLDWLEFYRVREERWKAGDSAGRGGSAGYGTGAAGKVQLQRDMLARFGAFQRRQNKRKHR